MKYQWEKAPERMAKDIKIQAEAALEGDIIMNTMTTLLIIAIMIYFYKVSKDIESIIFALFLPGIGLFFMLVALIVKIKSYYQAKKGKFMKLKLPL